jgi:Glyoxalase-like domain
VKLTLDHLVVAARSLDEGVAWCEAVLGITPGPGGKHDFMGTHNRLFSVASPTFPRAYFEIIAIDPDGAAPVTPRWFDLDQPAMQVALADGPKLVHWMARTDALAGVRAEAAQVGLDIGAIRRAQRLTEHGPLTWQIAVRADGARLFGGAFPGLIEWGEAHPTDRMPPSGVLLERVGLRGLMDTMQSWWPAGVQQQPATASAPGAPLEATLSTPRGLVRLAAPDL